MHIYIPTDLVTKEKLRKLKSAGVDEIRLHPRFLDSNLDKEVDNIKIASKFWERENIGIEIPMFPDKVKKTLEIIKCASPFIGFVNLNELEISDTNFAYMTKRYKISDDTYAMGGAEKEAGMAVLRACEKLNLKLKLHLCTARTKNFSQYKNRLKLRRIMPFGFKTKEGSVKYFVVYNKDLNNKSRKQLLKNFRPRFMLTIKIKE